jgi:Fe-S cluster assembly protein SufD
MTGLKTKLPLPDLLTMNPTTTAINLTDEINEAFDKADFSSSLLSRKEGIEAFKKIGLPGIKTEEYRFTPITRLLTKNFKATDFSESRPSLLSSIEDFLIPGYDCNTIVFVNGQFKSDLSSITSPSEQFTLSSLDSALAATHSEANLYFTKLVTPSEDAFAALNTAFWQSGVFIRVPDNTVVEKPIFILHIHEAEDEIVNSQTRVLVVIGTGSKVSIVEKSTTIGSKTVFSSGVEEITVLERATLNYHRIQNDPGELIEAGTTCIHQHASSHVNTFTLTLDGQLIRNNLHILVDGENCESHFYGLYLLDKETLADNHTVVDHRQPNSYSNELYKGIMDGHSKGVFNGKIYVRPHAQKTNAFQSNRNILLSDTSSVNTKPQLEIWADDVKCSHGCTSGQLDEEALFYLQSRGISKQTARAMVLNAFASEVLQPIQDQNLKGYLDSLVSERLQKNL